MDLVCVGIIASDSEAPKFNYGERGHQSWWSSTSLWEEAKCQGGYQCHLGHLSYCQVLQARHQLTLGFFLFLAIMLAGLISTMGKPFLLMATSSATPAMSLWVFVGRSFRCVPAPLEVKVGGG